MSEQPTSVQLTLPSRPVWVDLLVMVFTLGAMGGLVLAIMPAQERQMLLMSLRQARSDLYRGLSARARRAGFEGMTSELEGRDPGVWYERARGLAWWRDRVKP